MSTATLRMRVEEMDDTHCAVVAALFGQQQFGTGWFTCYVENAEDDGTWPWDAYAEVVSVGGAQQSPTIVLHGRTQCGGGGVACSRTLAPTDVIVVEACER